MRIENRRRKEHGFKLLSAAAAKLCAVMIFAVIIFIALGAAPAIKQAGVKNLFGFCWQPQHGRYGISAMLLCSLTAAVSCTAAAFLLSVMGGACFENMKSQGLKKAVRRLCAVLCTTPSTLFGLWGLIAVIPRLQKAFPKQTAQTGGATLLAAVLILTAMLIPFMLPECMDCIRHAKLKADNASAALGATDMQTVFKAQLPHAGKSLWPVAALGIRRAFCEAMAVQLVSGNVVNMPSLFGSVRLLGSGLVLEMGYAFGTHRSALFFIGLVMLLTALAVGSFVRGK